jgi:hypothetical protein
LIPDGKGGYTESLLEADAGWVGDYEITDRRDLAKGRVWIENRPMGDAVGAINKVVPSPCPGGADEAGPTRVAGLGRGERHNGKAQASGRDTRWDRVEVGSRKLQVG